MAETLTIEIPIEAVDCTGAGVQSATRNLTAFERAWDRTQRRLDRLERAHNIDIELDDNSIKYVPNKDYKRFTAQLKKVYGAASLKAAESEFERFRQAWSQYPGAVDVWVRNWQHVAQLFSYGSAVRKILYTTNAVESVNSSFRKVTKKGLSRMRMRC